MTIPPRPVPWAVEHRRAFLALVPPIAALVLLAPPGETTQIVLVGLVVGLVGIPHGALDLDVAETPWPLRRRALAAFAGAYVGLTLAVLALWLVAPGLALGAFLAYSALHFGTDWEGDVGPACG